MNSIKLIALLVLIGFGVRTEAQQKAGTKKKTMKSTTTKTSTKASAEVPLIDRSLFFGNPTISGGKLSPDGKHVTFLKELDGIMNIWIKKVDEPFEKAHPLTNSTRPLYGYFWTYDSKNILYIKDNDGDENMNIFVVNPLASPASGAKVPDSRNLTPLKEVTAQIIDVSKKNPDKMIIGLNDRDKAWHDLYELEISTGKLTKKFENKDRLTGWIFDWSETPRLAMRTDEKGNTEIMKVENDNKFKTIYTFDVTEQAYPAGFTKDNSKVYLVSNKGNVDLSTLYLMDPTNGSVTYVESDPLKKVDFGGASFDENTHELLSTSYTDDKTRIYWRNKDWEANYKFLQSKFPGREVDFSSSTLDYSKFLVAVWGDKYMTDVYFFDPKTKKLTFQYTPRPDMKPFEKYLAPMKPVTYKSSDGLTIPAYLTLPTGKIAKNLPVVMLIHGGPKGPRDGWGYDGEAQFLANRGYAVLQPNFRASGGYGKKFLNAGDKEWGRKMQDDITYGVKYLINQGIADKNNVAIMGGSYGGYATLAGLTFTPDLYKAGVDIVGPSNLYTLLESIPAYWESGRAWLYEMVGDPKTEEGKKLLTRASPLFHSDNIIRPLMIIQGANDPRVKKAESEQIVVKLRDKGQDVQYLMAKDEGHGFAKPLNRMAMYAAVEEFLAKQIGGRYEKDMPADVRSTLETLRQDISKVEVSRKAENLNRTIPVLHYKVKPGTTAYTMMIEVQGQKIPMDMTREISSEGDNIKVTESVSSPQGNMKDETIYDHQLMPLSRTFVQGPAQINLKYSGNKANMEIMGQSIDFNSNDIILSNGAGFDLFVAAIPQTSGYQLSFDVADINSAKTVEMILNVMPSEEISGKKYTVVEVHEAETPDNKTIYWIDPATQDAYKTVQSANQPVPMTITTVKK